MLSLLPSKLEGDLYLVEGRYYTLPSGEIPDKGRRERLRVQLHARNRDQTVNPPFGNPWYDTTFLARAMLIEYATGGDPATYSREGYGTNGTQINVLLREAGLYDDVNKILHNEHVLSPEQVIARVY